MFQQRTDEIFKDLPCIFGIADDILIVGYDADGINHNRTLGQVMEICHQENLKVNNKKFHFRCTKIPFFGEVLSRKGMQPDHKKLCVLTKMPT